MKQLAFALVMCLVASVRGLDNTQTFETSEGFWDTTGYVNVVPETVVAVSDSLFERLFGDRAISTSPESFSTFPVGFLLLFR